MDKLDFLDKLRAIAQIGLNYAKDPFDLERYRQLLDLATQGYAELTALSTCHMEESLPRGWYATSSRLCAD